MDLESRHQCLIYNGAPSLKLASIAEMIQRKLGEGCRCLYLNSPTMVSGLRSYLAALGIDVVREVASSRLVLSSETTAVGPDGFDTDLMLRQLEDALDQAIKEGHSGLWATGDMTWEFGPEKNLSKLLEYEYKLEDLLQKRPELQGVCQYHVGTMPPEIARQALLTHQTIFINETLSRVNPFYQPSEKFLSLAQTNPGLDGMISKLCQLH